MVGRLLIGRLLVGRLLVGPLAASCLWALSPAGAPALAQTGSTVDVQDGVLVQPLDALETEALAPQIESTPSERVILRGLDKFTGQVETLEGDVGAEIAFQRLSIAVDACYERRGDRAPESSAFLRITDRKYEAEGPIFSGWMFASSPALSAMDHARYDVWVLSCASS